MSQAEPERERWSSRLAYVMSSIGAAVGLGNIWRFPAKAFTHGGGAFFVPYLCSLFFLGIPLMMMEVGIGQMFQGGSLGALSSINPRFRLFGLVSSSLVALCLVSYYVPLLAWFARMLFYMAWDGGIPWFEDDYKYAETGAFGWLKEYCLESKDRDLGDATDLGGPDHFSGENFGFIFIIWVLVWATNFLGVKASGYINYVTVGLSSLIVFVLFCYGFTLEGHGYGVYEYLGRWDFSKLSPVAFADAATQIFFSLGLVLGMNIAYASYREKTQNLAHDTYIVAIANSSFSIVAGFAVFCALGFIASTKAERLIELCGEGVLEFNSTSNCTDPGWLSHEVNNVTKHNLAKLGLDWFTTNRSDKSKTIFNRTEYTWWQGNITEVLKLGNTTLSRADLTYGFKFGAGAGGPSLLYGTYPVALASMGPVFGVLLNIIFFLAIIMLGVSSAFAITEAIVTNLLDVRAFRALSRKVVSSLVCGVAFLCSIIYASDVAMSVLGGVDTYVNHAFFFLGIMQVTAVGWAYGREKTIQVCGSLSTYLLMAGVFGGSCVGCLIGFTVGGSQLPKRFYTDKDQSAEALATGALSGGLVGILILIGCAVAAVLLLPDGSDMTRGERIEYLFFGNTEQLRGELNRMFLGPNDTAWYKGIPKYIWSFCIRYFSLISMIILTSIYISDLIRVDFYLDPVKVAKDEEEKKIAHLVVGFLLIYGALFVGLVGVFVPTRFTDFLVVSELKDEGSEESYGDDMKKDQGVCKDDSFDVKKDDLCDDKFI